MLPLLFEVMGLAPGSGGSVCRWEGEALLVPHRIPPLPGRHHDILHSTGPALAQCYWTAAGRGLQQCYLQAACRCSRCRTGSAGVPLAAAATPTADQATHWAHTGA